MGFLSMFPKFQNLMASIFSFKTQLAQTSKRKQVQSSLNTLFGEKQGRKSDTTPTMPAAALIKKIRKFREPWNKRLNFRIPGHLICVFKCCYRSPTVFIINIITVYKTMKIPSSTVGLCTAVPFKLAP